jgi:hypothetical protein
MAQNNATQSVYENSLKAQNSKITINTIQRTTLVKRMEIVAGMTQDNIYTYDVDNLYPEKVKAIIARSNSCKTAVRTLSNFISGEGFEGDDNILNAKGQTGWDILRFIADEKAHIGFTLHLNYNILGEIVEINKVPFEFVRIKNDEEKAILKTDWRNDWTEGIEVNLFNLDTVIEEIREVGIENYNGQLLYFKGNTEDVYPLSRADQVLDDAQFEAEAKIFKLSNIQNGYSAGGILKYPAPLNTSKEIQDLKDQAAGLKGTANAGSMVAIGMPPSDAMAEWKFFESTELQDVDKLYTNQLAEAKDAIFEAFGQSSELNGRSNEGMFNQDSFKNAFDYYNSYTELDRKEVERVLTTVFENSIFPIDKVEIKPKMFIINEEEVTEEETNESQDDGGNDIDNE